MTAREAISRFDERRPNSLSPSAKLARLGELEARIERELIRSDSGLAFGPESELRAAGFDSMYHFWLCALFDLEAGDYARHAYDVAAAEDCYRAYADGICRTRGYRKCVRELKVPS